MSSYSFTDLQIFIKSYSLRISQLFNFIIPKSFGAKKNAPKEVGARGFR